MKKYFFDTAQFDDAAQDYILVYVDIPRNKKLLSYEQLQHYKELTAECNRKGIFSLLKVLDGQGKPLGEYSRYSMNGDTRQHLRLLRKYDRAKITRH